MKIDIPLKSIIVSTYNNFKREQQLFDKFDTRQKEYQIKINTNVYNHNDAYSYGSVEQGMMLSENNRDCYYYTLKNLLNLYDNHCIIDEEVETIKKEIFKGEKNG